MPKRYILALVILAVVIVGIIILVISLLSNDGPRTTQEPVKTTDRAKELTKDTSSVSFTTYGRVVGEEERRAIRMVVSSSERRIEILQGYDEDIVKSESFPNKQSAYDAFLVALNSAGFDNYDKDNKTDDRSQCATGRRYVYEAKFNNNESLRSWSTSCSTKISSFKGSRSLVQTLFQNQIPDYSKVVSGVRL